MFDLDCQPHVHVATDHRLFRRAIAISWAAVVVEFCIRVSSQVAIPLSSPHAGMPGKCRHPQIGC